MAAQEHAAASATLLALYLACVRRQLKRSRGYECQEADGTFMLAFCHPADAVQFCLTARRRTAHAHSGAVAGHRRLQPGGERG